MYCFMLTYTVLYTSNLERKCTDSRDKPANCDCLYNGSLYLAVFRIRLDPKLFGVKHPDSKLSISYPGVRRSSTGGEA